MFKNWGLIWELLKNLQTNARKLIKVLGATQIKLHNNYETLKNWLSYYRNNEKKNRKKKRKECKKKIEHQNFILFL